MSIASSLSRPPERRSSLAFENFRVFSILSGSSSHSENRMQRSGFLKPDDVATSIALSGWVAAASSEQVRLYNVKSDRPGSATIAFTPPSLAKKEKIRAVALSDDLLAIITHRRLLVFDEYRTRSDFSKGLLTDRPVDQTQTWTPNSISISQTGMGRGATATIAVGGEGDGGVKLFKYVYTTGWNASNDYLILRCPGNSGVIKDVGFSAYRSNAMYGPMVLALTMRNHMYCWSITRGSEPGVRVILPSWHIDCNRNINERAYGDETSSTALVISPTGRPHAVWTADHRPGSNLPPSFLVPVDIFETNPSVLHSQIRHLPESVVGGNVLAVTASPNGQFLVVVEQGGTMKLLTLQGAQGGGLTCAAQVQMWKTGLRAAGTGTSKISISVEEKYGELEITAVDGKGHIVSSKIKVPDMPKRQAPHVSFLETPSELTDGEIRSELSGDEGSGRSVATFGPAPDAVDIIPR